MSVRVGFIGAGGIANALMDREFQVPVPFTRTSMSELALRGTRMDAREAMPGSWMSRAIVENRAFIEAIRSGDAGQVRSTYEDAVKTLAVTLACNESAMTGLPVKVES